MTDKFFGFHWWRVGYDSVVLLDTISGLLFVIVTVLSLKQMKMRSVLFFFFGWGNEFHWKNRSLCRITNEVIE